MSGVSPFRRHNSTPVSSFVLSAYSNPGSLRWLFFCVLLLLYLLMVFSNLLLIVVIALNRTLHEPMYLLLCSLFLNELYGSAALFPFLLVHILRDVHLVPAHFCFFQIYAIHSYAMVELLTLASMSYDRYVAICQPLHYKSVMSWRKTAALVLFSWSYSLIMTGVTISLSSSLELCGNVIDKVYCDNYPIIKLACYDTSVINVYGIAGTVNAMCSPLVLILFSYARILRVCQRGSRHTWHKAVHTCAPHLASLLNFTVAAFFERMKLDRPGRPGWSLCLRRRTGGCVPITEGSHSSASGQVYSRVLEMRIRSMVKPRIQEEQCGFRPGHGTGPVSPSGISVATYTGGEDEENKEEYRVVCALTRLAAQNTPPAARGEIRRQAIATLFLVAALYALERPKCACRCTIAAVVLSPRGHDPAPLASDVKVGGVERDQVTT
ncbi:hypothetical protein WMY93_018449 [Mugilogobius chulae]|uniref:G-protein coupled receptors family 1 profile domain-containing protein n=1 Tax=Mugilogobius chulae TaxID=88201 RepID=A0AAW0NU30_9GOBI